MPGPGPEHVIAILLLWNIVCGSHSASVENRRYITRVDIPDADDLSSERISVAMSKSWKEMPSNKNYIMDVDSKEFVNPNSRDELISSDAVSSFEQNSDTATSSVSKTKEYMRDKKTHEGEPENSHFDLETKYSHNLETDKGIEEWYQENPSNFRDRNPDRNHYEHINYPRPDAVYRTSKRSPRCLKKCLTQRLLHPAQCHSLC